MKMMASDREASMFGESDISGLFFVFISRCSECSRLQSLCFRSSLFTKCMPTITLFSLSFTILCVLKAPEFIFPVETRQRSWNEKWFDRVGTSYMIGLGCGGVWGVHEGLRNPIGRTYRMRANSLLNGLTRRGPFMANTLAVLSKLPLTHFFML